MTKARDLGDNAQNTKPKVINAKGDLIVGTGSDAADRLAVSDNGSTLVADSSTSTGLRYNPPVGSLANPVINGGADIWQRGSSVSLAASTSVANSYTFDRFQMPTNANQACTVSRQTVSDSTNLPNIQYAARIQRNSGQTGTGNLNPSTSIETVNSIPFAGKAITVSFYARAGANYSATSNALPFNLSTGTGTDQNIQNGLTSQTAIASGTATLTTTWQRFAFTGTVGSTATQLAMFWTFTPTGTAGANDWFELTGVQIDVGTYTASTAPTFRRSGGTLAGELAACQRYYYKSPEMSVVPGAATSSGLVRGGTNASGNRWIGAFSLPVTMRTSPTCVVYNPNNGTAGQMRNEDANTNVTVSGIFGQYTNTVTQIDFSPTTSANNVVVGYITASAEL